MNIELKQAAQDAAEAIDWLLKNIRLDAPQLSGKAMGNAEKCATALRAALAQQPYTAAACGIPGMAKTTCPYCDQEFAFEHEQPVTGEPVKGVIGMGAQALAGELAQAVAQDDADPEGHDMSAGLFGPNVSAWLRKVAYYAGKQPTTPEPVAWLDEMLADTREVFDANGSETPQVVRNVIGYVKAWVTVYRENNHPAPSVPSLIEKAILSGHFGVLPMKATVPMCKAGWGASGGELTFQQIGHIYEEMYKARPLPTTPCSR